MKIGKIKTIISSAKKNYYENQDEYNKYFQKLYLQYLNSLNNGSVFTNLNSNNAISNSINNSNFANFQSVPQVQSLPNTSNVPINNVNPNISNEQNENLLSQIPSAQQVMPAVQPNLNMPINVIAKNYITPDVLEGKTEEDIDSFEKRSKKAKQLAKIPDKLLKSSTDWEPINFKDVDESYHLYKLASVHIYFDNETNKVIYEINEPELTDYEKEVISELKKAFVYVFEKYSPENVELTEEEFIKVGTKRLAEKYGIKLTPEQVEKISYYLERDFLGLELIEPIMHDHYIEDISCDGLNIPIFVNHLKYGPLEVNRKYTDPKKLNSFIVKLAQKANQEVSLSKPILQGALPDGSRVEAIYGKEVSEKGSSFTIRKFREEPFTPIHLIEFGTMPPFLLAYLWLAVENKQSLLVSGGTATGKTTILNALSLFVPPTAKIVSIEDTPEINLPHEHWLPMISRESEGKAEVSMFDLLKASLRERPDYIIVGEIRGKEAAILFQGMATGHAGMGTVHAEKFSDLVNRMTIDPINLPKQLLTELKLVIFQKLIKVKNNMVRRTFSVVEVIDYDSIKDKFITNEFLRFNPSEDSFEFKEKSAIISHLISLRGGKEDALWTEIEKRRRILDYMHKNKILEFREVSDVIKYYYKDPSSIFDYLEELKSKKEKETNNQS